MDYPPVSNLISATFDQFKTSQMAHVPAARQAPQPVATAPGVDDSGGSAGNAFASSDAGPVGAVLNALA